MIRLVIDIPTQVMLEPFVMARKKKILDPVAVTVTVSAKYLEHLKRITLRISLQQEKVITVSEAIRAVLENAYPMPKTIDLFDQLKEYPIDIRRIVKSKETNEKRTD